MTHKSYSAEPLEEHVAEAEVPKVDVGFDPPSLSWEPSTIYDPVVSVGLLVQLTSFLEFDWVEYVLQLSSISPTSSTSLFFLCWLPFL